jgi:CBS domain-containing protein
MPTRPVSEVVCHRSFISVTPRSTVRAAAQLMKKHHTNAILVIDRKEMLAGICAERDIVIHVVSEGLDPDHTPVSAIMTRDPQTITGDKPFGHALHLMFEGGFHHVPVVDVAGHPVGILSPRDALQLDAVEFERELVRREEIMVVL